ncbi:MAG: SpoIIE family protein phosphatase [Desulfobacteraceae bacterium]|nr:SpoIIE family protein phosphatase [Desulfobacteraceae bacterium]
MNMTPFRKTYSIQTRMSFILLLTTTLIFAGFMLVYYKTTRTEMEKELSELSVFFADNLSISLATPLWDMNYSAIEGIMDAVMDERQVFAVIVKDIFDKTYIRKRDKDWKSISAKEASFGDEYVKAQRDIVKNNGKLGTAEIFLTSKFMQRKLNNVIGKMLITLIVLNILLFLLLFFSIRKNIIAPIKLTAGYLSRISEGDVPEKITGKYGGEFDEIRNSLNILINATDETILTAEKIANGNLNAEVRERSEKDRMMKALNLMIQKLNEIMNETNGMIRAVGEGDLDIRGNAEAFEGGWQELTRGVNNLIEGLSNAVSKAAAVAMEMELAKKIQTVLLPKNPKIYGYDIAASCDPADEVGGDYFDVISVGECDWIVIGDVTGHGVTSGLVMMMVQTAIHTVLLRKPNTLPDELLAEINKVIYQNIEKMEESKHMTIVVLARGIDGVYRFSGSHDDILIRRAETGKVDVIETDGMWIGLEPDISNMLSSDTLKLEIGDSMVLFTDGITEAINENGLFGQERLVEILEESESESACEIHAKIIQALNPYEKPDDVTLVVVKRMAESLS